MEFSFLAPKLIKKAVEAFVPTGTIVHDDKADWEGTFVNMTDVNDKLEMNAPAITEQCVTGDQGGSSGTYFGQEVYLEEGEKITRIDVLARSYTTSVIAIRLRLTYAGADLGTPAYTERTIISTAQWYSHIFEYLIPSTGMYYVRYDKVSGDNVVGFRTLNNQYRNGYCFYQGVIKRSSWDMRFKIWSMLTFGSYESQSLFVGAGVDWGKIVWDVVLDGATLVAKVRASDDEIEWTEWQTLVSGDYIVVDGDYLQYRYELTNATALTEIDNVEIEFAI